MKRSKPLKRSGWLRQQPYKVIDVSQKAQKVDTSPERVRQPIACEESSAMQEPAYRMSGVDIDAIHRGRYGSNAVNTPTPKTEYVRSAALMSAYRLIPCQVCGRDDGTVAGAHSNWATHGKGRSIKASDDRCASLCYSCHHELDQGPKLSEAERKLRWFIAHRLTVAKLVERDLWPRSILVPDISRNPFDSSTA